MSPIYQVQVFRGLKQIGSWLGLHPRSVIRLYHDDGLPLIKEGGFWTLTTNDYLKWREERKNGSNSEDNA